MKPVFFILFVSLFYLTNGDGLLPSYITPCDFTNQFEKCVTEQIKISMPKFTKGIPELKVPSLDPVYLDDVYIHGNSVNISLTKPSISGLGLSKLSKFELVPDVELKLVFVSKKLTVSSQYKMDGKILILPIQGQGDALINAHNIEIEIRAKITYVEDKKGKHVKLVSPTYFYKMEKGEFQLDNLFNGNKQLGDTTLKFLNENWKETMDELAPDVVKQTVKTCVKAINQFFAALTVDQIMRNYKPVF